MIGEKEEAVHEVREVRNGAFYSVLTAEENRLASLEAQEPESADRMSAAHGVQYERAPNFATTARKFYRVEIEKP